MGDVGRDGARQAGSEGESEIAIFTIAIIILCTLNIDQCVCCTTIEVYILTLIICVIYVSDFYQEP